MDPSKWRTWLRAVSADPASPANVPKGSLAMLTGQDARALSAINACWALYASSDEDGERAALAAVRVLLPALQAKCWFFARELIAFHLDWSDRERVWRKVQGEP